MTPVEASYKYAAFISYNHADEAWAKWLQKALETFSVPSELTSNIPVAGRKRLYPIFRDRDELPSSADLDSKVKEALRDSAYLIVVCSPDATYSKWVNEEIIYFKSLGREDRILALIVGGEPHATDTGRLHLECFPPNLRMQLGPDGQLTSVKRDPLAADMRPGKDGKQLALRKIAAGLLGVGVEALTQRDRQRQGRLWAFRFGLGGAVVAIATTAILGFFNWNDHFEYYRNLGERYGAPVGVDRMWLGEWRGMSYVYKVRVRQGRAEEIEATNGAGQLLTIGNNDPLWEDLYPTVAKFKIAWADGRPTQIFEFDSKSKPFRTVNVAFPDDGTILETFTNPKTGKDATLKSSESLFFDRSADDRNDQYEESTGISKNVLVVDGQGRTSFRYFADQSGDKIATKTNACKLSS